MTDETKVFDVADNDLRASASSCDANEVNLHHPLHPLVDAWEYVVGSTMYGKRDGTRDVGGAGEASMRTTTKTKTFPGKGDVSRGAGGGITLGRSPNDNQPRRAEGGGVSHNTGGGGVSRGARGGRGEAGGRICPPRSRGGTRDGRGAGGPRIAHPCPGNAEREGCLYCEFFDVGKEWQGPRHQSHDGIRSEGSGGGE